MKRFFLCIFILVLSITFLGCARETNEVNVNGDCIGLSLTVCDEIVQTISFSVNSQKIRTEAKNEGEYQKFLKALIKSVDELRMQILFGVAMKYIQYPNEQYKINNGVLFSQTIYDSENDTVGFSVRFASLDVWSFYHQQNKGEQRVGNEKLFVDKIENNSLFPFCEKDLNGTTVGESFLNRYTSAGSGLSFEENKKKNYSPRFVYSYIVPNLRIKSNADYKACFGEKACHVWVIENTEKETEKMVSIWCYEVYTAHWLIALFIAVIFIVFISLIILKFKKNN